MASIKHLPEMVKVRKHEADVWRRFRQADAVRARKFWRFLNEMYEKGDK